jgi:hypothetical protein
MTFALSLLSFDPFKSLPISTLLFKINVKYLSHLLCI